ncbi:hypothetical protein ACFSSF_01600 [Dietzia aerolata]|uniref:hypothetical protein n=1 Tax=Dietzia aerolata TaxID=595984 RepID=UPI003626A169
MAAFSTPASRARDAAARAERVEARRRAMRGPGARRGMAVGTVVGLVVGLSAGLLGGVALGSGAASPGASPSVGFFSGGDDDNTADTADTDTPNGPVRPAEQITLAFAGDVHLRTISPPWPTIPIPCPSCSPVSGPRTWGWSTWRRR